MDEQLLQSLADELQNEFNDLESLKPGSEEYSAHVKNIETLWLLGQKEVQMAIENEKENYKREQELINNALERKDKFIDRVITIGSKVIEIAIPTTVYIALFNKGLKFEETGTVTSTTNRNLLGKIPNPFRK